MLRGLLAIWSGHAIDEHLVRRVDACAFADDLKMNREYGAVWERGGPVACMA